MRSGHIPNLLCISPVHSGCINQRRTTLVVHLLSACVYPVLRHGVAEAENVGELVRGLVQEILELAMVELHRVVEVVGIKHEPGKHWAICDRLDSANATVHEERAGCVVLRLNVNMEIGTAHAGGDVFGGYLEGRARVPTELWAGARVDIGFQHMAE